MRVCVGDIEADGLLDTVTQVWCGVFKDIKTGEVTKFSPLSSKDYVSDMLQFLDTTDVLIFHNGSGYDFPMLEKLYGYKYQGQKVDTLIMSRTQQPKRKLPFNCPNKKAGPHSVEAWGYRVGRGKPEHNDWSQFSPEMLHRCSEDVEIQHLIFNELQAEAKGFSWKEANKLNFRLFEILHKQEEYGWLVSREQIDKNISLLDHWIYRFDKILTPQLPMILEIEEGKKDGERNWVRKPFMASGDYAPIVLEWMQRHGIPEGVVWGRFSRVNYRLVNLDSNGEAKDFLLREGWQPELWNYKKDSNGKPVRDEQGELIKTSPKLSYDEPFLGIESNMGKYMAKRVQCRHRRSVLQGWIKIIRPDGRIAGVVSGLAATGRATHGGIVNVPGDEAFFGRAMRKCFVCKPGTKIVGTDSAGCQNRMLAARVGDDSFTKTLIDGKKEDKTSIHFVNQAAIKLKTDILVPYRDCKSLNYGWMFGASDKKLGLIINRSKETGAMIREAMLGVSPGLGALVEALQAEWRSHAKVRVNKWGKAEYYDGWVAGLDGRPIFIEAEHTLLVYMLQSDEAIMMARAYVMLYDRAEARGWKHGQDWGYLVWYHDEYQAEVREDIAEEFSKLAEQCIVDAGEYYNIACPHKGESEIGNSWYETH